MKSTFLATQWVCSCALCWQIVWTRIWSKQGLSSPLIRNAFGIKPANTKLEK